MIGQDHTLWLETRLEEDGRPYVVLDPDGDPIGTVVVPERSRISAAQRDRVWILETDDLGVQSVVRYAVTWADPS